jgi:lipopolysaccharide biosynthesis protein
VSLLRAVAHRLSGWLRRVRTLTIDYPLAVVISGLVVFIPRVRAVLTGADPNRDSKRYLVYASYDRSGLIADYVVDQVAALATLGYRTLFVSTSPRVAADQAAKVAPYCWQIVHRRNLGHDFGSYKEGIRRIVTLDEVDNLLLMNDSCYGPLFDLAVADRHGRASGCNLWGITDSWNSKYHIQSYYLLFDNAAVRSRAFRQFWASLLPYQSRELTILNGELRLTRHLVRSGMKANALCPYETVANRALVLILERLNERGTALLPEEKQYLGRLADSISRGASINPMHSFWDILIAEFACPFLKRNLLRENPARIRGLVDWPVFISEHTKYPVSIIHDHLRVSGIW